MSDVTGPWFPSEFSSTVLLLSHKSLTSSILNSRCDLILFLQGDDHLLSLIPSIWFDTHCILWARDVSSTSHISQFSNGFHTCLNPIQHEGVLCGQYHFFSNRPFLPPPKPSVIQRRLCHIINPATKGITSHLTSATKSDPLSANSPSSVHGSSIWDDNGGLPAVDPFVLVCCKSVFSASKWCIRRLSIRELAAAHDVPTYMIPAEASKRPDDTVELPFLFTAPIKLLLVITSIGHRYLK